MNCRNAARHAPSRFLLKGGRTALRIKVWVHTNGLYISHYNVTLNKCFMLEIVNAFNPKHPTLLKILLDVNSNKEYGEFFGNMPGHKSSDLYPMCFLGEKFCASEAEWDAMAGVYMEEDGTGK